MKTPSVLAFERKLDPSDALFAAGKWDDWAGIWTPVVIHEKSVRGTISNRLPARAADPASQPAWRPMISTMVTRPLSYTRRSW
mgnify:CR=1 FL=1